MKPIILKEHSNNKDIIVYGNHVMYGGAFWDMKDESQTQRVLHEYGVSDKAWQEVLDAIEAGKGNSDASDDLAEFAFNYSYEVDANEDMRQIILNENKPRWAYLYCFMVNKDPQVRQIVLDAGEPRWAYLYCRWVANDEDMRQVIIDNGGTEWANVYCLSISYDEDMRQVAGLKPLTK